MMFQPKKVTSLVKLEFYVVVRHQKDEDPADFFDEAEYEITLPDKEAIVEAELRHSETIGRCDPDHYFLLDARTIQD